MNFKELVDSGEYSRDDLDETQISTDSASLCSVQKI